MEDAHGQEEEQRGQGSTSSHGAKDINSSGKKRRRGREENDGALENGLGLQHGEQVTCKHPEGCTNSAQNGGMCTEHSDEQDGQGSMSAVSEASDSATAEASGAENTTADAAGADETARSDTRALEGHTVPCQIDGCPNAAEKRGRCQLHIVKQRCSYPGGCMNKAHGSDKFCLTHRYAENEKPRAPPPGYSKQTIIVTARQQEFQARQYCEEVLSARSKELATIYAATEDDDAAGDAASLQPLMETTARKQQKIAEQFCNEEIAARAINFIVSGGSATKPSAPAVAKNRGAPVIKECNIRSCRNLVYGREPLCAAHQAWATGCYPASVPPS